LSGHGDGLARANNSDLSSFPIDQADFRDSDAFVDARFRRRGLRG